ncbi:hypothetical protein PS718_01338 [Pseudomonas fluorescens]|uniref:Metalloprotease n=1 Tax=Pseudomonas fluorescens TaxID=294 RepID=A0A5E7B5H0_PSEFL|nr:neutral zinc metallopeptidase [Pseudomonas fluorescens]VVN83984.1 hypothetical protein PS718_01338 [Pseudomonas fluorescens]
MLWNKPKRSEKVDDQRKDKDVRSNTGVMLAAGLAASLGVGSLAYWLVELVKDPAAVAAKAKAELDAAKSPPKRDDPHLVFVEAVLGSTEEVWTELMALTGQQYQPPTLVLYNGKISTGCDVVSAIELGPVYCPEDQKIYIDLDSLGEIATTSSSVSDFAQAVVIAHEVGHHVQNLSGVLTSLDEALSRDEPLIGANELSVRRELQADCLAGVWAQAAQAKFNWLEPGDIEEALTMVTTYGDDKLGATPESFTHGTSQQRLNWFNTGFNDIEADCRTFDDATL